jgi:peptide/nickel transport system substrate-binding protein
VGAGGRLPDRVGGQHLDRQQDVLRPPVAAAAALVAVLLGGCSPASALVKQGPQQGGTFVEATVASSIVASSINPLFAADDNARDIDSLIYQGLTTVDASQNVAPLLARKLSVSGDGLTYTAQLRSGVRWADGQPLGVTDVLFTFSVLQDPTYTDPAGQFWKQVKVEDAGDDSVRFTLKAPDASFPVALRQPIIPRHVFARIPISEMPTAAASTARAFGTGPFRVESLAANQKEITLRRNPYASPAPHLDSFVFHGYPTLADAADAVARGAADGVGTLQAPQLASIMRRSDVTVHEPRTFSFAAALFNLTPDLSAYFNPPAVRQAMVQAIDRRQLVQEVLNGHADAAPGPIPPTDWAYDPQAAGRYPFDRAAAMKTLDGAGWVLPAGGSVRHRGEKDFSISLVTADAYPYLQVADSLSRQLALVGIQVTIDPVPPSILVSRYLVGKHYQMALIAFDNGPDPDQFSLWHSSNSSDPLNFASVLTPKQALIDKDLEDGRTATTRKARKAAYDDFQDLMSDAAPAIFLYEPHYAYVVSQSVHGVHMNAAIEPVDRFQYVTDWWVDVKRA